MGKHLRQKPNEGDQAYLMRMAANRVADVKTSVRLADIHGKVPFSHNEDKYKAYQRGFDLLMKATKEFERAMR